MTGPDDEFEEFLARKRPVFRRPTDDGLEPPDSVDRLVLRQARDAIKPAQPERLYRGPGWGVPIAVAATLLVCLSMVLNVVLPKKAAAPEAATRQIAHEVDARPASGAAADASADKADELSNNPPPPPMTARRSAASASPAESTTTDAAPAQPTIASSRSAAPAAAAAPSAAPPAAPWRGNARSWLAQIERLRAEGKTAEADAELALYKSQHRAYAGSPDR